MTFITLEEAAKLSGINYNTLRSRLQRGKYPEWAVKKQSRPTGGFEYLIVKELVLCQDVTAPASTEIPQELKERKERKDKFSTSVNHQLLFDAAAVVTTAKASSPGRLKKGFGYKQGYRWLTQKCEELNEKVVTYRRFIDLVKPLVDKQAQELNNLGVIRFKNKKQLFLNHDYSVYEPMQFLQNDHTQFDCMCLHDGKVIRPWAAFHVSLGDRVLSYPTIVERPDSYSLADNIVQMVMRYGLSNREVMYKSDHGKAQKSRLMTRNGFEDVQYKGFDLEERHHHAIKLLGLGSYFDKGLIQNLGMIETHSLPRQPWTKLVERQFGIGGTMEWFVERKEYTGRKYEEKPEQLEKWIKNKWLWTSEEMIDYVIEKVDCYNNSRHSAIEKESSGKWAVPVSYDLDIEYFQNNAKFLQLNGGAIVQDMSEVYNILNDKDFAKKELKTEIYSPLWRRRVYELCGWVSRPVPNKETLAMLTMNAVERVAHNYGINLNGLLYINYDLIPHTGKKLIIRYSPSNITRIKEQSGKERLFISEIYVFERTKQGEKFLGIATPHPRVVHGLAPVGYAKTFLSIRNEHMKQTQTTLRIAQEAINKVADEKEKTFTPEIIELKSFREQAATKMSKAIEQKKEAEAKKVDEQTEIEQLYKKYYGENQ